MADKKSECKLTDHHVAAANAILSMGRRVFLVPVKDGGIKVFDVNQKEVKIKSQATGQKPV